MGLNKKKFKLEFFKKKLVKLDKVNRKNTGVAKAAGAVKAPGQTVFSLIVFTTFLQGLSHLADRWPREALRAVLGLFQRMPRDGWCLSHSIFCNMFKYNVLLEEFRKRANFVSTTIGGVPCTQKKFVKESAKRVKSVNAYFEENTLYKAKVFQKAKQRLFKLMQNLTSTIDKVERTKKIF